MRSRAKPQQPGFSITLAASLFSSVFLSVIVLLLTALLLPIQVHDLFLSNMVNLPITLNGNKSRYQWDSPVLTLAINQNGRIYVNREPCSLEELQEKLYPLLRTTRQLVYVKADRMTSYGRVQNVLMKCRSAGATRYKLLVQAPEKVRW